MGIWSYVTFDLIARELRASPEVEDSSLHLVELFLNFFFNRLTFLEMVKGTHAEVTNKASSTAPNVHR